MYELGTIKLTHLDPNDYTVLKSEMYKDVDTALNNTEGKKKWLLMKLETTDNVKYKWKLLPYGSYRAYTTGMYVSDRPLLKFGSYALMLIGLFVVGKYVIKNVK